MYKNDDDVDDDDDDDDDADHDDDHDDDHDEKCGGKWGVWKHDNAQTEPDSASSLGKSPRCLLDTNTNTTCITVTTFSGVIAVSS